ncbi:hypothetical protein D3C86_1678460 [compost metagenome]
MAHAFDFLEQSRQRQMSVLRTAQTGLGTTAQALRMVGNGCHPVAHLFDGHRNGTHSAGLCRGTLGNTRRGPHQLFGRDTDRCRNAGHLAHSLLEAINQFVERLSSASHFVSPHHPYTSGEVTIAQFDRRLLDFPNGSDDLRAQQ